MKRIYLYQLFKHSKPAFLLAILFIALYAIHFFKKMDMLIFPYNRMFATVPIAEKKTSTFAVLLNGERVPFTKNLYWRKDFLEQSPAKYAGYLQRGGRSYLQMYFEQKKVSAAYMQKLEGKLFISKQMGEAWASWYCRFAGYNPTVGSLIELKKYELDFRGGKPVITDSTVLYTQRIH